MVSLMNTDDRKTGYFLFSLDTELGWGNYDHFRPGRFSTDGKIERQAIKRILNLLADYNIVATWAVVGHLFYEKCEDCDPCPIQGWRGKYLSFEQIYDLNSPLFYGSDVIDTLLQSGSRHEIAFHGFTHRIFDDISMDGQDASYEIQEWMRLSKIKNIVPQTVIFPRNQLGHLRLFKEFGFICFRGKEILPEVYSMPIIGRLLRRFHRQLSSFLPSNVYELPGLDQNGLVNLPSTQHFFGYDRRVDRLLVALNLDKFSTHQMLKGINKAADQRKIFHIRAHPSDFRTDRDFEKLRYLFANVSAQVEKGLLQSIGLADLARKIRI